MTNEDLETIKEALKVIADKIIDESGNLNYYCYGCKWEFESYAIECDMCSRIRVDNYERREDASGR